MSTQQVTETTAATPQPHWLPYPATVDLHKVNWVYTIGVVFYHIASLAVLWPWLFSWTGVALALLGCYAFGTLGINLCYHRLLTHRGFACPRWLEHTLAIVGVCCLQDTPARWVATHRLHHQNSDEQADPHSPLVNFFWGHMGWLFFENSERQRLSMFERYAKDLLRDPFYLKLERNVLWVWINLVQWVVFFAVGFLIGWLTTDDVMSGAQFGLSIWLWGVIFRTVLVWHITWSVNSVTHRWGYRNYHTDEDSRNNFFIGIVSNGEGWHNNHHADPRSARHGHRWWEFDVTWITVRLLQLVGLAWNVVHPNPRLAAQKAIGDAPIPTHQENPATVD